MIIEYLTILFLCYFVLAMLFSPAIMLQMYLNDLDIPSGSFLHYAATGYLALMGLTILFISYLAHQITRRTAFEDKTFSQSISETFADVHLKLAFVPILGKVFRPKEVEHGVKYKNND